MVTFRILEGDTHHALASQINSRLNAKWKLHGVTFANNGKFYQAVTLTHRKEKVPK